MMRLQVYSIEEKKGNSIKYPTKDASRCLHSQWESYQWHTAMCINCSAPRARAARRSSGWPDGLRYIVSIFCTGTS